jgi:hypothetical protein
MQHEAVPGTSNPGFESTVVCNHSKGEMNIYVFVQHPIEFLHHGIVTVELKFLLLLVHDLPKGQVTQCLLTVSNYQEPRPLPHTQ